MFIRSFTLPIDREEDILSKVAASNGGKYGYVDNAYPCGIFKNKGLQTVNFDRITILYGGNGSGKSTLLNLIAQKLDLERTSPFNKSETFDFYVEGCRYSLDEDDFGDKVKIPRSSRIITSDDVFDYMLAIRTNNEDIEEQIKVAKDEYLRLKYSDTVKLTGLQDYDEFRLQVLSRKKSVSRRKFVRMTAGREATLESNGETALSFFDARLKCDSLYCLDEPENSLSPKLQMKLADLLCDVAYRCGSQLILATHSPFLLSINGAKVYDLDSFPAKVKNWWELEGVKDYFGFFEKNRHHFLN